MAAVHAGSSSAAAATPAAAAEDADAAAAAAEAYLLAALPRGVRLEALRGPWMLAVDDVMFHVTAAGERRILFRGVDTVVYGGSLHDDPVGIEQAFIATAATADGINAWLARVQVQVGVKVEGALRVYGGLVFVDSATGAPTCFTVTQRAAGSVGSLVLAGDGALAAIGMAARLRIVSQAAAALAALHARRIAHGDVTPDTVLLSSTSEATAAVLVAGYGHARNTDIIPSVESAPYRDPALMADPAAPPSAASDTYAWAILAWHVLTGLPPYAHMAAAMAVYDAATWTPAAAEVFQAMVCGSDGARPSVESLINRGVPMEVVSAILDAWAGDPVTRPTMATVARVLAAAAAAALNTTVGGGAAVGGKAAAVAAAMAAASAAAGGGAAAGVVHASDLGSAATGLPPAATAAWDAMLQLVSLLSDDDGGGGDMGATALATMCTFMEHVEVVRPALRVLQVCPVVSRGGGAAAAAAAAARPDNGVGAALVAALRTHCHDAEVVATACVALYNLTRSTPSACAPLVHSHGGGAALAAALLQGTTLGVDTEVAACRALYELSMVEGTEMQLMRDGCGAALLAALRRHGGNLEVARAACGTLWNLTVAEDGCDAVLSQLGKGAVAAVVSALQRHVEDEAVVAAACGAFRNLMAKPAGCAVMGGYTSALAPAATIVAALEMHAGAVEVVRGACGALWNLIDGTPAGSGTAAVWCDDAVAVATGLRAALLRHVGDEEVVRCACGTLRSLIAAAAPRNTVLQGLADVPSLAAAEGAALARHVGSVEVARGACCALSSLTFTTASAAAAGLHADASGMVATVAAALLRHTADVHVAQGACSTLRNFALYAGTLRWGEEPATAVVAALLAHSGNVDVVVAGCGALWNLAATAVPAPLAVLTREGTVGAIVVSLLTRHASVAAVARVACGTLQAFAFREVRKELLPAHLPVDAAAATCSALVLHLGSASVAQWACCALGLLAEMDTGSGAAGHLVRTHGVAAMDATVQAAQRHADNLEVVRVAAVAMRQLAAAMTTWQVVGPHPASVAAAVAAVLQRHVRDEAVAHDTCSALWHLVTLRNRMTEPPPLDACIGVAVVAALQAHTDAVDVLEVGCGVLEEAPVEGADGALVSYFAAAAAAVSAAVQRHAVTDSVAGAGGAALWNLTSTAHACLALAHDRTAPAVVAAAVAVLSNPGSAPHRAAAACRVLRNLARWEPTRAYVTHGDSVGVAVVAALARHVADEEVSCDALGLLRILVPPEVGHPSLKLAKRCVKPVVSAMTHHTYTAAVVTTACDVLRGLVASGVAHMSIVRAGAGRLLVTVLEEQAADGVMVRASCNMLRHLAATPATRTYLVATDDAAAAVLDALEQHAATDAAATAAAVGALAAFSLAADNYEAPTARGRGQQGGRRQPRRLRHSGVLRHGADAVALSGTTTIGQHLHLYTADTSN